MVDVMGLVLGMCHTCTAPCMQIVIVTFGFY